MTTLAPDSLKTADSQRLTLLSLCRQLQQLDGRIGGHFEQELSQYAAQVESEIFRVLVVGDFRRGKSTLINALLGENVLPSKAVPTTAVLTEVRYAQSAAVRLLRADSAEPEFVSVRELADRILIDNDHRDQECPYIKAEVFWPIELCRNGIAIIDSPGLNEHAVRTETTLRHLKDAHAIIVVQDVLALMSMDEQLFLDTWLPEYDVLFAFNKINLIDAREVEDVRRNARQRVADAREGLPTTHEIHFVDAKGGLVARQSGNDPAWVDSGMAQLEEGLATYLVKHRQRARILAPGRALQRLIGELQRGITRNVTMLESTATELAERYERERRPLAHLEGRASTINMEIGNAIGRLSAESSRMVRQQLQMLAREIPEVVAETKPTAAHLTVNPITLKKNSEAYCAELASLANSQTHRKFNAWVTSELGDFVRDGLQAIADQAGDDIKGFQADMDDVRRRLTGTETEDGEVDSLIAQIVDGMSQGPSVGVSSITSSGGLAHLMQQITLVTGVAVAWFFSPLGWVTGVAAILAANALKDRAVGKLRAKIVAEVGTTLKRKVNDQADAAAEAVRAEMNSHLSAISDSIGTVLANQVSGLRADVEAALAAKRVGDDEVAGRRGSLRAADAELSRIKDDLDQLMHDVALS